MGVTLKFIHGDKPPFQIDANMGFVSAVYEMLLYSGLDKITLLPALPDKWKKGSVSGLRTRVGAMVDIAWDENKASATLTALYDTTFKVRVKDGKYTKITLRKGEKYVI